MGPLPARGFGFYGSASGGWGSRGKETSGISPFIKLHAGSAEGQMPLPLDAGLASISTRAHANLGGPF